MQWTRVLSSISAVGLVATLSSPATAAPAKETATAPQSPAGSDIQTKSAQGVELKIRSFTLDNGLRVYVVEDHSVPAFSMHTAFAVGSRDEEAGHSGFAHFFEHMMFKGSKNVPDGGHMNMVLAAGGALNAFTTTDVTQYFNVLPSHYLDLALWLESDRLRSLEVTQEGFDNQRDAVKEERSMRIENPPYTAALRSFFAKSWSGSGYGHLVIGSKEDLNAAKRADVQTFFDRYYVPNNATIAIVGDVDFDDVKRKVANYYGGLARGESRKPIAAVDHTQVLVEERAEDANAQQPLYLLGWKTVPEHHADRPALELLQSVLLRGDSARITKILKDERKLVVAALAFPSGASGGLHAGMAMTGFVPLPGKTFKDIQAAVLEDIAKVKKRGISAKDLQKAKNQRMVDAIGHLATNNGRAHAIANGAVLHNDPFYALSDLERYQKVTARDIKRVANKYFTDKWLTLEIVPKQ